MNASFHITAFSLSVLFACARMRFCDCLPVTVFSCDLHLGALVSHVVALPHHNKRHIFVIKTLPLIQHCLAIWTEKLRNSRENKKNPVIHLDTCIGERWRTPAPNDWQVVDKHYGAVMWVGATLKSLDVSDRNRSLKTSQPDLSLFSSIACPWLWATS